MGEDKTRGGGSIVFPLRRFGSAAAVRDTCLAGRPDSQGLSEGRQGAFPLALSESFPLLRFLSTARVERGSFTGSHLSAWGVEDVLVLAATQENPVFTFSPGSQST